MDVASTARASGGALRPLPAYMQGVFSGNEASYSDGSNEFLYEVSGPIRVPVTGLYFLKPIRAQGYVDSSLEIHDAPFDPEHPFENLVPYVTDQNFYLHADQDYYFVEWLPTESETGKWMFTLAQQSTFFINPGMNGNWWNPEFNGQGFFVDVLADLGTVFVGWFTYDVVAPSDPAEAVVGYSGSRWLTAYGPYDGASADLAIELTTGGRFGDAQEVVLHTDYGGMHLDFQDCATGTVSYEIPELDVVGEMDIVRINHGNERLCAQSFVNTAGLLLTD